MISQLVSPTTNISSDAAIVIPGLQPNAYKVYAAVPARVYHAAFGSKQSELNWTYSGLHGRLMFGKDRGAVDQGHWFRLLDDAGKTVWIFKIPELSFDYCIDKPFFHVFRGSSRKFGLLYYDDDEAASFAKKVIGRTMHRPQTENHLMAMAAEVPRSFRSRLASATIGRLSPAIISSPTTNSFVHIAHVGAKKVPPLVEREINNESTWTMVVAEVPDDSTALLEQHNVADECMKMPPTIKVEDGEHPKPRKVRRKPSPKIPV
ncbi:Wiskott-Aldrich syndrome 1 [Mycena sanguinolenta]|uniref:Wiskott-Aldrich syndrome 1 n=1 Tax=Mycena sanguinolenta TaxID=230812 RepID=A0A8H7DCD9_9AGAR|nr:Wiskott-Aldrich syndrome 1 [Mycena sanguinolenta]